MSGGRDIAEQIEKDCISDSQFSELLSCPCCGSDAELRDDGNLSEWYIICTAVDCTIQTGEYADPYYPVTEWNRRQTWTKEQLEAIKKYYRRDSKLSELSPLLPLLTALSENKYVEYINICQKSECAGAEYKIEKGIFKNEELKVHQKAHEKLGEHKAFSRVIKMLEES